MPPNNTSDILGPVDSAFYFVDTPQTPMNIGAVTIFEGTIVFPEFIQWVKARIYQAPPYQKRIVDTPFNLGQPKWVYDPNFDVSRHVMHHQLDAPGTDEQLREFAGYVVSGMLDRSKPLWEIHLINGLEGGRTAVLFKVHHSMVDGLSAVELFTLLLDLTPQTLERVTEQVYAPPPLPTPFELLANAVGREIPNKLSILSRLGDQALHMATVLTDSEERRKTFVGIANLINDNLSPIQKLLINGTNTGKLTLAWTEFPLTEVRAIRARNECTVNEVMVTLLGTAIETYVRKRGETSSQRFVRLLAPFDVRTEEEKGKFGNRIAVLPIDIPFDIEDPLERLHRVAEHSQVMKQSGLAMGVDMILTLPSLALNFTQPFIWKVAPVFFSLFAHSWCTNVVGPQIPIYLSGHKMLASYGYFPLNASMGLACVIMSYNQKISMTLIADAGIVPDVKELRHCLEEAYVNLRAASKVEPVEPVVSSHPKSAPPVEQSAPIPRPEPVVEAVRSEPPASSTIPLAPTVPAPSIVRTVEPPAEVSREPVSPAPPAEPSPSTPLPKLTISGNGNKEPGQPTRHKIFTEAWAQAYRVSINNSPKYRNVSRGWTAGALAFVMHACPEHGFAEQSAVILDLDRGECHNACALPLREARARASFVLEGDYENWIKVLTGQAQPIPMIMRNKLALTKGSMFRLLPFTQSAEELVNCAQNISEDGS